MNVEEWHNAIDEEMETQEVESLMTDLLDVYEALQEEGIDLN